MKQEEKQKPVICILGGMGPQASAQLLTVLVDRCSQQGAVANSDFPEVIVDSVPVPDFISDTRKKNEVLAILKQRVENLNSFSPTVFGIVCNSAHIFLKDLKPVARANFVSLIEKVSSNVKKSSLKRVGLLTTPTSLRSKLYQQVLSEFGIEAVVPNKKDLMSIELIIRRVLAGKARSADRDRLSQIAQNLRKKGAEGIILGCTELPLVFPKELTFPIFDSIEILAKALVREVMIDEL